jgi:D-3-phosphoglycerate dehydrogenase
VAPSILAWIDENSCMTATVEPLVLDLLEWLARRERSYAETMDAWRTSCPRLPVWEDANDEGLVSITDRNGRPCVCVTPEGFEFLRRLRPGATQATSRA